MTYSGETSITSERRVESEQSELETRLGRAGLWVIWATSAARLRIFTGDEMN